MFCGQCGKRINEDMLYCPFCGTKVVIPEQQGFSENGTVYASDVSLEGKCEVKSLFDETENEDENAAKTISDEEFKPLVFPAETVAGEDTISHKEPTPVIEKEVFDIIPEPSVESKASSSQTTTDSVVKRKPNTFIPARELDAKDLFMDSFADDEDDYDLQEEEPDVYPEYEERENGSFVLRHIRGIVTVLMLLLVFAVAGIWMFTSNGQITLAKYNLAWKAAPYTTLAEAEWKSGNFVSAAHYYEKAYAKEDSYEYAKNAVACYTQNGDYESATRVLLEYIDAHNNNPDAYADLMYIYGDASSRPVEISNLLRTGYALTGDARLKT